MKHLPNPCADCHTPMVTRTRTERTAPEGYRIHAAEGRCNTCYQRRVYALAKQHKQAVERDEPPCLGCKRPLVIKTKRGQSAPEGSAFHHAKGLCSGCYNAVRKGRLSVEHHDDDALTGGAWVPGPRGVRVWRAA